MSMSQVHGFMPAKTLDFFNLRRKGLFLLTVSFNFLKFVLHLLKQSYLNMQSVKLDMLTLSPSYNVMWNNILVFWIWLDLLFL